MGIGEWSQPGDQHGHSLSILAAALLLAGMAFSLCACSAPPEIVDFRVAPTEVTTGETVFMNWVVRGADEVAIEPGIGVVEPVAFSEFVPPAGTTTYIITARNGSETVSASVVVRAEDAGEQPVVPVAPAATPPDVAEEEAGLIAAAFGAPATVEYDTDILPLLKASGKPVVLVNRPTASNPSYFQLRLFIESDTTDRQSYLPGEYIGTDFAEALHNAAEACGYRAAVAAVAVTGGGVYPLNIFNTTDAGIVFVDCTGLKSEEPLSEETRCDADTIAYVRAGRPMGLIQIAYADSPEYAYYEQYLAEDARLDELQDALDGLYEEFETLRAGRTEVPEPDYSQLRAMQTELNRLGAEIQSVILATSPCRWSDIGTPAALDVWW